jgi:hypothetical protein
MLSHRAHTDTLGALAKSNNFLTQVDTCHTKASDQWNFYQAKNIRKHEYEALLGLSEYVAKEPGKEEAQKKTVDNWKKQVDKYNVELPQMMAEAKALEQKAEDLLGQSEKKAEESEHFHHRADWFDAGELGIEIALIVCSVALLTKRSAFWYLGVAFALIGAAIAASGFLVR